MIRLLELLLYHRIHWQKSGHHFGRPLEPPLGDEYSCSLISKLLKDHIKYGGMLVIYIGRLLS